MGYTTKDKWEFSGYTLEELSLTGTVVTVLTPRSYVKMFLEGFIPKVHNSLEGL